MSPVPTQTRLALRRLTEPLTLAAIGTWGLIVYEQAGALPWARPLHAIAILLSLVLFLGAFLWSEFRATPRTQRAMLALQIAMGYANLALIDSGSGPILGVIAAAQLPFLLPVRAAFAIVALSVMVQGALIDHFWQTSRPWFVAALFGSFQCFALLVARLAHTAERQRDELAQVNAHLLATRSLLEAGARDGERLRVSRELHDVAGHGLTALKLHLELALRVPEAERAKSVAAARDLVDALLEDIRAVVGQLRRHDGVSLAPALQALVERVPGPQIEIDMDPSLRVHGVATAEAVLRCVQEALTNALRHSNASRVRIALRQVERELQVSIEDDGRGGALVEAGHGLTGMRERIEELGGRLVLDTAPGRGFRVQAVLPLDPSA